MNRSKVSVLSPQKNNQADHSDSHLVTSLRLIYRLSALLEEKIGGGEYSSSVKLSLQGGSRA